MALLGSIVHPPVLPTGSYRFGPGLAYDEIRLLSTDLQGTPACAVRTERSASASIDVGR